MIDGNNNTRKGPQIQGVLHRCRLVAHYGQGMCTGGCATHEIRQYFFPWETHTWIKEIDIFLFSDYDGNSCEGTKCSKIKGEQEIFTAWGQETLTKYLLCVTHICNNLHNTLNGSDSIPPTPRVIFGSEGKQYGLTVAKWVLMVPCRAPVWVGTMTPQHCEYRLSWALTGPFLQRIVLD